MERRVHRGTKEAGVSVLSYRVNLYCCPPRVQLLPNPKVFRDGIYAPSSSLQSTIGDMLRRRNPTVIGDTSERVIRELIEGGAVLLNGKPWTLSCQRLRDFAAEARLAWKPGYGIHCDDLATIATGESNHRLLFLTESKGTTREHGLSRGAEAKMFYQVARTFAKLKMTQETGSTVGLGGIISAIVNHHSLVITINVNDDTTSFAGGPPDRWMYPDKNLESL